ncbi:N-acetylmuramoyl-L-alanine amidase [Blastococcus xanthinilyticus]|uniref:N-acetylmuramoyl-L-alanine amidase n=1 Tax=Blastococcus xanthinilyticus TaxID=1564164 RepID=A0A5S5CXE8_9ACTN|nr:N-acetylmuramoyl-L-alanine amidase [Blastococcus xanthinilyticus]TYP87202.1 N-acetylmuramoyl-L-alanine amidase [Blastococcus xanthinilyticus]
MAPAVRRTWGRRRRVLVAVAVCAALAVAVAVALTAPGRDPTATESAPRPQRSAPAADAEPAAEPGPPPLAGRTVALDPGHNRDNGRYPDEIGRPVDAGGFAKQCNTTGTATDAGVPEATLNWELALDVRERLEALGATVVLTRDQDAGWGPCIDERARIANRAGAHLLLSLHADGAAADAHGFHVIHPASRPGWTDDIAADSARAATTVRDALVAAGLTPATYLGQAGLDERDDLGTLNQADVPAVLLEAGNLRNADDAALLTGEERRGELADALAGAVRDFLAG